MGSLTSLKPPLVSLPTSPMGAGCRAASLGDYPVPPPSTNHCKDVEAHLLGSFGSVKKYSGKPATHLLASHEVLGGTDNEAGLRRRTGVTCRSTGQSFMREHSLARHPTRCPRAGRAGWAGTSHAPNGITAGIFAQAHWGHIKL